VFVCVRACVRAWVQGLGMFDLILYFRFDINQR